MVRYNTFTKTITLAAVLLLVSQFCVYASNDYLSEKETEWAMALGITMTTTVDYVGNYVYENGTLTRILFDGGYVDMTGTAPKYMFYLTDHLGNVRVVADSEGNIEQVNHYYPYGDRFDDSRYALASSSSLLLSSSSSTDRLFGGKELDSSSGLHDFEARYDNTMFGRFTTIDPMAEKYYGISPYSYCSGNPVNRVDPYGTADYFSYDGIHLYNDENDDGEIRIIHKNIFDDLYKTKDPEDMLNVSFNQNLFDKSCTFTGALRNDSAFSRNAALRVINYFTENEVVEGDLEMRNSNNKRGSFGTRFNAPIMVDFDVLMNDGKRMHDVVGTEFVYYTYIYDNSYNIKSAVDDHERYHQNDPSYEGDREARAYAHQVNSLRFAKCTKEYQDVINDRLNGKNK